MHYALLSEWARSRVDDLVVFGVPRVEAESLMAEVERGAIAAESEARREDQFLLDFKRLGSDRLGHRRGKSGQAMRQLRSRILAKKQPDIAEKVAD